MLTADDLLAELKRVVNESGPDVTLFRFRRETGIGRGMVRGRWGTWTHLRVAAGLPPRNRARPVYSDDELFAELHRVTQLCQHWPKSREFDRLSDRSWGTFASRFGRRWDVFDRYRVWLDKQPAKMRPEFLNKQRRPTRPTDLRGVPPRRPQTETDTQLAAETLKRPAARVRQCEGLVTRLLIAACLISLAPWAWPWHTSITPEVPMQRREFLTAGLAAASATMWSAPLLADDGPPSKPRIKIGQIGVGHAHASKLAVYRTSPDYEVVGIVEPDAQRRKSVEGHNPYRDLPWMTVEQLLNVPGLQAVLVETEVRDLLDNAEACVVAGKHVHLDKPAGESLPQYRRILDQAKAQNLLVQMGYMYRYNPAVVLLRELLKQGWLGDVFEIHTVMSKVVDRGSRRSLAQYRGGMMFELGCHILDLTISVLGEPQQVTPFVQHSSPLDDGLNDNMLAVLTYPRAIATVKSSAIEVDGGSRRHFVVCGTEGTFHIQPLDNPSAKVTLLQPRGPYKRGGQDVTFPRYVRYVDDAADMARIIRGEKPTDLSYEHDLAVQTTLLKACGLMA